MKKRDYIKKRSELTSEYQQKIEALEIVWRMFNPDEPLPMEDSEREAEDGTSTWPFEISKRDVVRQAIATLSGEFGAKDVRAALSELNESWSAGLDDNQLSSLVARLAEKHEIGVTRAKTGRAPAIYTKSSAGQHLTSGEDE
jgi:hypothetical protein